MEKQNNQICTGLLHNCTMAMQAEKKVTKKENKLPEHVNGTINKMDEKPWSIFGDVYWI